MSDQARERAGVRVHAAMVDLAQRYGPNVAFDTRRIADGAGLSRPYTRSLLNGFVALDLAEIVHHTRGAQTFRLTAKGRGE